MVTEKAKDLGERAKKLADSPPKITEALAATHELLDELIDCCNPTDDEFDLVATGVLIGPSHLLRISRAALTWV